MLGLLSFAPRFPGRNSFDRAPRDYAAFDPADPRRAQIMARIFDINPSATQGFLSQFPLSALCDYLEHLESAAMPRGRDAVRARPSNTAAISSRRAGE